MPILEPKKPTSYIKKIFKTIVGHLLISSAHANETAAGISTANSMANEAKETAITESLDSVDSTNPTTAKYLANKATDIFLLSFEYVASGGGAEDKFGFHKNLHEH